MSTNSLDQLRVFNFNEFEVRIIERDGQPWWVGKDVCDVLELTDARKSISLLDEDERNIIPVTDALGRQQETYIINEPGLYSLILRSRKPEAKAFKRWIVHEVLPSIRKTGSYSINPRQEEASAKLQNAQARLQNAQANLLKEKTKQGQLIAKVIVNLKKAIPSEAMAALTHALSAVMTGERLPAAQVNNRLQPEQAILWGVVKLSMLLHIERPKDWSDQEQIDTWWEKLVQEMEPQMIYFLHSTLWAFSSLDDFTLAMREKIHERHQKLFPSKKAN